MSQPRTEIGRWSARMLLHGALVLLLGLCFGVPFGRAVVAGLGEEIVRGWRLAHLEGISNGLLTLVLALALARLSLPGRTPALLAASMIAAAYGNTLASALGALFGVRGLEPAGPLANAVVFAGFMVGMFGSLLAVGLAAWGAARVLRGGAARSPADPVGRAG